MAYDYLDKTGASRIFTKLKGWLEENAGGKRATRFTIGTTANGWAKKDCDYLCDGTADDVEINAAIAALPATGGEIVLLDGTYNLAATIQINKAGVTLSGNGAATKLVRGFKGDSTNKAIVYMNMTNCVVRGIAVDGVKESYYAGIYNQGIESFGNKNTIEDCIIENVHSNAAYVYGDYHVVRNVRANGNGCGVNASGEHNIVIGCVSTKNDTGIYVSDNHNVVEGCVCLENDIGIEVSEGSYNIINGNVSRVSSENNILVDGSNYNIITDNDFSVEYGDGVKPTHAVRINDSYCIGNTVSDNMLGEGVLFDAGNNTRVGGQVATGSYTGDGTGSKADASTPYTAWSQARSIALPFSPSILIFYHYGKQGHEIIKQGEYMSDSTLAPSSNATNSSVGYLNGSNLLVLGTCTYAHATCSANASGLEYYWVAFK